MRLSRETSNRLGGKRTLATGRCPRRPVTTRAPSLGSACRARNSLKHDGCDLVRLLVEREVSRVGDLDEGHVRSCS